MSPKEYEVAVRVTETYVVRCYGDSRALAKDHAESLVSQIRRGTLSSWPSNVDWPEVEVRSFAGVIRED